MASVLAIHGHHPHSFLTYSLSHSDLIGTISLLVTRRDEATRDYRQRLKSLSLFHTQHALPAVSSASPRLLHAAFV